jgi:hypothetical protein
MYLGQSGFDQIIQALPQIAQSVTQVAQAFETQAPVGVTPNYYPPPSYYRPQQQASFGIDPMTLTLIAGGALVLILLMKR